MRSHQARGLARLPEPKQLPSAWRGKGRQKVLAMREARAPLERAERELSKVVPRPAETLALLRVRREHQAVQRDVNRRRPLPLSFALSQEPGVRDLTEKRDAARRELGRLKYELRTAERHLAEWRRAHPYRFGVLGDVGLLDGREGRELEAQRHELAERLPEAEQAFEKREAALATRTVEVEARLRQEREAVRRELLPREEQLERLEKERRRLETREQARDRSLGLDRDTGRDRGRGGLSR